jgi:glutaryl-CoA dehydrogenase
MSTQTLPYAHLGDALATDYYQVREQFTEEQWEHLIATRRFVDREVLPVINQYWEAAELPWPPAPRSKSSAGCLRWRAWTRSGRSR